MKIPGLEDGKCPRVRRFIQRLPADTRKYILDEIKVADIFGYDHTSVRKVMPGEEPKRTDWKCQGKVWALDHIKSGLLQMCPQENLQYISYHLNHDMVLRYCPRCAEYLIENPDDRYFERLDIPPEVPKHGWRPNPMPKGWKP